MKTLQEKAKEKGKTVLIEQVLVHIDKSKVETFDKPQLVESSNGDKYKARGIIRDVPVTKFTENLNGRIYPRSLEEKIIKEKLAEGTLSLADHPSDDGSVKSIAGTWHNYRLTETNGIADWYLVGELGQLILETIQAGGKIGISRVGLGSFKEDEKTVDEETYELERLGDAVLTPSQQVYATYENVKESIKEEKEETIGNRIIETKKSFLDNSTNFIKENSNNKSNLSEQKEDYKMDKFLESNIKTEARNLIGSISRSNSLFESFSQLSSFYKDIPDEMTDTKQEVRVAMSDLKNKISEEVSQKDKKIVELEEKYVASCKVNDELKEKYNKACALIDSEGSLEENISAKLDAISKFEEAKKESEAVIAKLKENETIMLSDLSKFKEAYKKFEETKKVFEEELKVMKEDIDIFIPEREAMLDDINKFIAEREDYIDDNKKLLQIIEENHIEIKNLKFKEDNKKEESRFSQRSRIREDKVDPAIKLFYEKESKEAPALADIKEEIYASKSLYEAMTKVDSFLRESMDKIVTTNGRREDPDWLHGLQ